MTPLRLSSRTAAEGAARMRGVSSLDELRDEYAWAVSHELGRAQAIYEDAYHAEAPTLSPDRRREAAEAISDAMRLTMIYEARRAELRVPGAEDDER